MAFEENDLGFEFFFKFPAGDGTHTGRVFAVNKGVPDEDFVFGFSGSFGFLFKLFGSNDFGFLYRYFFGNGDELVVSFFLIFFVADDFGLRFAVFKFCGFCIGDFFGFCVNDIRVLNGACAAENHRFAVFGKAHEWENSSHFDKFFPCEVADFCFETEFVGDGAEEMRFGFVFLNGVFMEQ